MSKDLPYFKFYASEWSDGDITLEDHETQGLFVNVCAFYWSRRGEIAFSKLCKRFANANQDAFQTLISEGFLKVDKINDRVLISFLDEQIKEFSRRSEQNRLNGQKGGRGKKSSEVSGTSLETQKKAVALQTLNEKKSNPERNGRNKEEKRGEEKRQEEKRREEISLDQRSRQSPQAIKTINERKISFIAEVKNTITRESISITTHDVKDFVEYWTEHGFKDKKMKFEKERSFGISRRLSTWIKNGVKFGKKDSGAIPSMLDEIENF